MLGVAADGRRLGRSDVHETDEKKTDQTTSSQRFASAIERESRLGYLSHKGDASLVFATESRDSAICRARATRHFHVTVQPSRGY